MKIKQLCCLGFVCCLLVNVLAYGGGSDEIDTDTDTDYEEYVQELDRIRQMARIPRTDENQKVFEKFADEIESKWSKKNKNYYGYSMIEVCRLFQYNLYDATWKMLCRKYALIALNHRDALPVERAFTLTDLVAIPTRGLGAVKGKDYAKCRRENTEVELHMWKRLIDAIAPSWDRDEIFTSHPPCPTGETYNGLITPGMSPENYVDPEIRAKYAETLEQYKKRRKWHSEQRKLRDMLKKRSGRAPEYISKLYSLPPFDMEELQDLLDKYIENESTRLKIIETVRKNIEEKEEGEGEK